MDNFLPKENRIIYVKAIAIGIFFLLTIIIGGVTIPCFSSKSVEKHARTMIPLFKCLTGGLFLGIVLLDLLWEGDELVREGLGKDFEFPMSGVIIGAALFFVLGTEQIIDELSKAKKKRKKRKPCVDEHKTEDGAIIRCEDEPTEDDCDVDGNCSAGGATLRFELSRAHTESFSRRHTGTNSHAPAVCESIACQTSIDNVAILQDDKEKEDGEGGDSSTVLNRIIITIVLCFHTLMEGLGLGLQSSSKNVWNLLIPLSLHQSLLAFIFTVNLLRCHFSKKVVFLLIFILGVSAVIGAGIGAYFSNLETEMKLAGKSDPTISLVNGILLCIATGTFLFITFFEMLNFEGEGPNGVVRLIAALLGFAMMGGLDYMKYMDSGGDEGGLTTASSLTTASP